MIINFSLIRICIIFLLVILFPIVQKQWLNLYLFNINNFTIYKFLYYISGLIVPILVVKNSLDKFTYYKFNYHHKIKKNYISGRLLLLITLTISIGLSIFISQHIFINLEILLNIFLYKTKLLVHFDIYNQILFLIIIATLLLFKRTKYLIKKIILTNFFIFSIITWYSQINNSFLINVDPFYNFKFEDINFLNIGFLLVIEMGFYLWSYISYSSYLSDWKVPKLSIKEFLPILNIVMFYLSIIFYYSILLK